MPCCHIHSPSFLCSAYKPDEWEVDKECVTMHSTLGEGAFGRVFAGTLTDGKVQCNVAVKVHGCQSVFLYE